MKKSTKNLTILILTVLTSFGVWYGCTKENSSTGTSNTVSTSPDYSMARMKQISIHRNHVQGIDPFTLDAQINNPFNPESVFPYYGSTYATLYFSSDKPMSNVTFKGLNSQGVPSIHSRNITFTSDPIDGVSFTYPLHAKTDVCPNCDVDLKAGESDTAIVYNGITIDTATFTIVPF